MTDKEALKLALEALTNAPLVNQRMDEAVDAIEAALAQPEQEPVGWSWVCNECGAREFTSAISESDFEYLACSGCGCKEFHKEALAKPERSGLNPLWIASHPDKLAQPEQEPVVHQYQGRTGEWHNFMNPKHYEATVKEGSWPIRALYTTPPQRKPLTDEQFLELLLRKGTQELVGLTTFVGGSIQMQGKIGLLRSAKIIKEFVEAAHDIKENT